MGSSKKDLTMLTFERRKKKLEEYSAIREMLSPAVSYASSFLLRDFFSEQNFYVCLTLLYVFFIVNEHCRELS